MKQSRNSKFLKDFESPKPVQQSLLWKPGGVEEAEEEDDSITQLPIENIVLRAAPGFDRVY